MVVRLPAEASIYISPQKRPDQPRGPIQPHIQLVRGIKRSGPEADHSLATIVEFKNA
jgi:hypothetical protein